MYMTIYVAMRRFSSVTNNNGGAYTAYTPLKYVNNRTAVQELCLYLRFIVIHFDAANVRGGFGVFSVVPQG